ncbi:unnamed protein product, partial [Meganyctiphanes norvegica]
MAAYHNSGLWKLSGVPMMILPAQHGRGPAYALVGSLNGVHVFGESHGVTLCSTRTQNATITWKTYQDSVRLVLIRGSECVGDSSDGILLDLVFSSLVLLLGLDTLTTATNIERLKRDIRPSFPLLDELLARAIGCDDHPGFSHLTGCAECLVAPEHNGLQVDVEKFAEGGDSTYSCLMLGGAVVCGTKNFWSLSNTELVLLTLLVNTNIATTARDLPIYLPNKSPNVPFRMLVVRLTGHVSVVTLCGPTPTLAEMIRAATSFWAPSYQTLEALTTLLPWNITPNILSQLDHSVIGLLLVNYDVKRSVSCVHLSEDNHRSRSIGVTKKMSALRSAYRTLLGPLMQPPAMPPEDVPVLQFHHNHIPLETYVSTELYKIYLIQSSPYQLLVLFPAALPVHIARQVSHRTLSLFTKGKVPKL